MHANPDKEERGPRVETEQSECIGHGRLELSTGDYYSVTGQRHVLKGCAAVASSRRAHETKRKG